VKAIRCIIVGALVFSTPGIFGHRINEAFTTVVWNAEANTLEVSHRLHLHDAIEVLSNNADLDLLENRARLALYAADHFLFYVGEAELCDLEILGAQIEGVYIYVYQECNMPGPPTRVGILPTFFNDKIANQTNDVNIEIGGQIKSLSFSAGDRVQWLGL